MLKKKTLSKIFKSTLIFLTLSVFVVSCDNNSLVQDEPEEGGSELGEEKSTTISAPTGVTVTAGTEKNSVIVKWTPNGSDSYIIYYNTSNDTSTASIVYNNANAYLATNGYSFKLSKSGTYYFWVKAVTRISDSDKTSDFSTVVSFNFTLSLPSTEGLKVVAGSKTNTVKVTWTSNESFYYWIYYNTANDSSTAICATKAADSTTAIKGYKISLPSTGKYYFWIKSAEGTSDSSNTSDFSSPVEYDFVYTVLVSPSVVTIEEPYSYDEPKSYYNYIKIKWTNTNYSNYWIYYNTTNDTESAECIDKTRISYDAIHGYSYLLKSSGTYYFWVKSAEGPSDDYATSDFSPVTEYNFTYTEPSAPTGVKAFTKYEPDNVKILWNNNHFHDYWIYYNTVNDTSTATCVTKSASAPSKVAEYSLSLPTKEIYYFWIKAADDDSETSNTSDFSLVCSVDNSMPKAAPAGLKVVKSDKNNSVTLTCEDNGSSYYWIYYSKTNDPSTATLATSYAKASDISSGYTINLSELSLGYGTYYFWIKGADGSNKDSLTSDFSAVATYEYSLIAPSGITVEKADAGRNCVKIKWVDNGAEYYWIYYNNTNDTTTARIAGRLAGKKLDSSIASEGYPITLPVSGTYYFWIKSADGIYDSSLTSEFSSDVVAYEFTNTIPAPEGITVEPGNKLNTVVVKWTANDEPYYHIYYNTKNDTSSAIEIEMLYAASTATQGEAITLESSGTYYFWIRAGKGGSAESDYSSVYTYNFTYTELTPPTGLTIEKAGYFTYVVAKWNNNKASYYYIYYNTINDIESARKKECTSYSVNGYQFSLPETGTYYFWIRSANTNLDNSDLSDYSEPVQFTLTD